VSEDTSQELRLIAQLWDCGVLSDREFERERRAILRARADRAEVDNSRMARGGMFALGAIIVAVALVFALTPKSTPNARSTEISLTSASSTEESAVKWAEGQVGHSAFNGVSWAGLCLTFAYDAYKYGAGVSLEARTRNISYNSNTDPQAVWGSGGNFTSGTWQATSNPNAVPYGALVFFNATPPHDPELYSHVAIMDSNETLIMTPGSAGQSVFQQTFAQRAAAHPWNAMVGWWLPDGSRSPSPAPAAPQPVPSQPTVSSTGGAGSSSSPSAASTPAVSSTGATEPSGSSSQGSTASQIAGSSGQTSAVQPSAGQTGSPTTSGTNVSPAATATGAPAPLPAPPASSPTSGEPTPSAPTGTTTAPTTTAPPVPQTYPETVGGVAHTWSNYTNAGGSEGPTIAAFVTVQIDCKMTGFKVADGDTWWYRITSSPWSDQYYVSADAFYNNGQTSGTLIGTPFVDMSVPSC